MKIRNSLLTSRFFLWVGSFALLMILYLQLRPIDDCDIFSQIKLGELTLNKAEIIKSEPFVFWRLGEEIGNPGWLAQLIYAQLYSLGGFGLICFIHTIFYAGAFLVIVFYLRTRDKNSYSILSYLLAMSVALLFIQSFSSVRPQGFSLFGCAILFLYLSWKTSSIRNFLGLSLLCLIWQNIHPSLMVGLVVLGSILIAQITELGKAKKILFHCSPVLLMLALCLIATPEGINLFNISAENVFISRTLLGVSEWMPPWDRSVRGELPLFWPVLLYLWVVLLLYWREYPSQEKVLVFVFTGLALYSTRFIFYLGLFILPILIRSFEHLLPTNLLKQFEDRQIKVSYLTFSYRVLLFLLASYFLNAGKNISSELPISVVQQLKLTSEEIKVFNYREWGGIITFYGWPKAKVFIDGRLYLYGKERWEEYLEFARGNEEMMERIYKEYSPDILFLHKGYFEAAIVKLRNDQRWKVTYEDLRTCVFERVH